MKYREHAPYHIRRLEQQMLDTLLRIEDLLKAFLVLLPVQEAIEELDFDDEMNVIGTKKKPVAAPVVREDVFDLDGHKVGSVPAKAKRK
jgi:hypothetical protein